ncbi:MAG: hypothetical protein JWM05_2699 [Acidimicrobiales bacterium]|nr:hypothetical protein [Acidimicrobiales bacterium]
MRTRRLIHVLVLATTAWGVPLAADAASAVAASSCSVVSGLVWTNATGDASWSTSQNWDATDGTHRVPSAGDDACIDSPSATVTVPAGTAVRSLTVFGDSDGPFVDIGAGVDARWVTAAGPIRFSGDATVGSLVYGSRTEVAVGARVTATSALKPSLQLPEGVPPVLDVAGHVVYQGTVSLTGVTVRGGGWIRPGPVVFDREYFGFDGTVDIQAGGQVLVARPWQAWFPPESHMIGGQPDLVDADVLVFGPEPVIARGETGVMGVFPGSTLTLIPEGERLEVHGSVGRVDNLQNSGTLSIKGPPLVAGVPQAVVSAASFISGGTLNLDRVRVESALQNLSLTRMRDVIVANPSPDTVALTNSGTVELAPVDLAFVRGATALVAGRIVNEGRVIGPLTAVLGHSAGEYSGTGTVETPLVLGSGVFLPGPRPMRTPQVAWSGERFVFEADGLAAGQADRLVTSTAGVPALPGTSEVLPASTLDLTFGGHVPCAGSRWQLMTWAKRVVPDPVEATELVAPGAPPGITFQLVERADGFVAIASGAPLDGTCSEPLGRRLVSGWFVDGLGRPATASQLSAFGDGASTTAGRRTVARELLGGEAATGRFITSELRRILGRPASAPAVGSYVRRLRSGLAPDVMRAEVYGGSGFWSTAGKTVDGWSRELYTTELGRLPTATEARSIRQMMTAGHSRSTVARYLLAGVEADRALADRSIALWWARPSTANERSSWAARYQAGTEAIVTADIAAADPIT